MEGGRQRAARKRCANGAWGVPPARDWACGIVGVAPQQAYSRTGLLYAVQGHRGTAGGGGGGAGAALRWRKIQEHSGTGLTRILTEARRQTAVLVSSQRMYPPGTVQGVAEDVATQHPAITLGRTSCRASCSRVFANQTPSCVCPDHTLYYQHGVDS